MEKVRVKKGIFALLMTVMVWMVIQFDGIGAIPGMNQIVGMILALCVWMVGAVGIYYMLRKQNKECFYYDNSFFESRDYMVLFFTVMGGMAISAGNYFYGGLKPLLVREFFNGDLLYTIRNVLYYPLEILLMLELLICSQRAGELLTKKKAIPWGALALFVLWGLPHIVYHGYEDGLVSALRAFVYCIPFYASHKKIRTGYIGMLILWMM